MVNVITGMRFRLHDILATVSTYVSRACHVLDTKSATGDNRSGIWWSCHKVLQRQEAALVTSMFDSFWPAL
jgi:hypothetical protein